MSTAFLHDKNELLTGLQELAALSAEASPSHEDALRSFREEVTGKLTFKVLLLGDFNAGKSTFINRFLLQEDVLPTSQTPCTAKLCKIKYSAEPWLRTHHNTEQGGWTETRTGVQEALAAAGANKGANVAETRHLELGWPAPLLEQGIVIVDSPGLNDPELERMQVTYDYVKEADCVLYLTMAIQALKANEREFLEKHVLTREALDKVFFVITWWDQLDEKDRPDVRKHVEEGIRRAQQARPDRPDKGSDERQPTIFPVSAKTGENLDELREVLWAYFGERRGDRLLLQKAKQAAELAQRLLEAIEERAKVALRTKDELKEDLAKAASELEAFCEGQEQFQEELTRDISRVWDKFIVGLEKKYEDSGNKYKDMADQLTPKTMKTEEIQEKLKRSADLEFAVQRRALWDSVESLEKEARAVLRTKEKRRDLRSFDISAAFRLNRPPFQPSFSIGLDEDTIQKTVASGLFAAFLGAAVSTPLGWPLLLIGIGGVGCTAWLHWQKENLGKETIPDAYAAEFKFQLGQELSCIADQKKTVIDAICKLIEDHIRKEFEEKTQIYKEALGRTPDRQEEAQLAGLRERAAGLRTRFDELAGRLTHRTASPA